MSLSADTLLDRTLLKSQLTKWRIGAIVLMVLVVLVSVEKGFGAKVQKDYIARISVEDVIVDDYYRDTVLHDLEEDKNAKAVLVFIDSPGGTVVGGEQLYRSLRAISEKKPVVAVLRTLATSAAYMGALGADRIVSAEGSVTGSIGVIMQTFEMTDLAAKVGVTPITIKTSPLKASPSPFEKLTPESEKAMQDVIDNFYNFFVGLVMEHRKLTREEALKVSDGRIYTGKQAVELKLVDTLGGEKEALEWLKTEKKIDESLEVKEISIIKPQPKWWEDMGSFIFSNPLLKEWRKPQGLVSLWQPGML